MAGNLTGKKRKLILKKILEDSIEVCVNADCKQFEYLRDLDFLLHVFLITRNATFVSCIINAVNNVHVCLFLSLYTYFCTPLY